MIVGLPKKEEEQLGLISVVSLLATVKLQWSNAPSPVISHGPLLAPEQGFLLTKKVPGVVPEEAPTY
jgi:hypothetical protein